jgi:16S rRNA C967 or C1407 C5-methylase (RsmB/RsmF family)
VTARQPESTHRLAGYDLPKSKISNNLKRLAKRLFEPEEQQASFIQSVIEPVEYPVAIVWSGQPNTSLFEPLEKPAWFPSHVDLIPFSQRPGRHEAHDQGDYYCLDPSSVFMMGALRDSFFADKNTPNDIETILDVCASPGGKSVQASRAIHPDLLIANEVIGKRLGALIGNFKRCKIPNTAVTSFDTSRFEEAIANLFDLVLVDAPCSGQSLIAKGKPSPGCFHPATINMNANRQRRILSNSATSVAPGGTMIYMTCTYSLKENEGNVDWFLKKNPDFEAVEVDSFAEFKSPRGKAPGYRLWPSSGIGAGGFFAVLKKTTAPEDNSLRQGEFENLPIRWRWNETTDQD